MRDSSDYDPAIGRLLVEALELPLDPSELELDTDLRDDLGLDSAALLEFVLALEDEFGLEIDAEEFSAGHFRTLAAVSRFVRSRLAPGSGATTC